jgi:hypothetical protein
MSAYHHESNGHNGVALKNGQGKSNGSLDGYMAQAEEWEREAVLDPAWERQQKKVRSISMI